MNVSETIKNAYDSVVVFNKLAGNLDEVPDVQIDNQLSYIFEELAETIDAFERGDNVELLDGACDLFVTVSGLLAKLEKRGYNVALAMQRVNQNNLSKFPENGQPLKYDYRFTAKLNEEFGRYVIKDETGKVRKPSDFIPVDLSDLVPTLK